VELNDLIWIAPVAFAAFGGSVALFLALRSRFRVAVPPNRALVLFGQGLAAAVPSPGVAASNITVRPPRIVVGGAAYVAPWNKGVGQISLDPVSVDVTVRSVQALEGSRASGWEVRLQVQAKVPAEPGFLAMAAENLLGKNDEEVRTILRRAVEGVVPAVLARLKLAEGEPDWDRLGAEIQASVAPDLVPWGLAVRTLSVVEVSRIRPHEASVSVSPLSTALPTEVGVGRASLGTVLGGLDTRLARAERELGALFTEVLRLGRGSARAPEEGAPFSVFDLPLGWESGLADLSTEPPTPGVHGSMGGEHSPRFRLALSSAGREEVGPDPRPP
jgi:SPFH domain / Band 7 family